MISNKIKDTWFYQTILKDEAELQSILTSQIETKLQPKSYLLAGNAGIGKTTQAFTLCRDYILANLENWHYSKEPDFVTFYDFVDMIRETKKFGYSERKTKAYYRLEELTNSPFLIFDDLKCEKFSEYENKMIDDSLHQLMSSRYSNRKQHITIITTNNTIEEITDSRTSFISEATLSRIEGLCEYIYTTGIDRRQAHKTISI